MLALFGGKYFVGNLRPERVGIEGGSVLGYFEVCDLWELSSAVVPVGPRQAGIMLRANPPAWLGSLRRMFFPKAATSIVPFSQLSGEDVAGIEMSIAEAAEMGKRTSAARSGIAIVGG